MSATVDSPLPATLALADLLSPDTAARVLNWCAANGGGSPYRRAAGHVIGGASGRPARDDTEALQAMADLLLSGRASSVEEAARFIAWGLRGEHSERAAMKRLATKYRKG